MNALYFHHGFLGVLSRVVVIIQSFVFSLHLMGMQYVVFLMTCFAATSCLSPALATIIQFGSCNKAQHIESSALMFASIASVKSDVFIWLGDIIYTDKMNNMFSLGFRADAIDSVRQQFKDWKQSYANTQLENSTNLLMGVWDDHDFGINDGGAEHVLKSETQQIFLDHFGVSADSPRRARNGVYSSEVIGRVGQRVRIILLDGRFHRDPIGSDGDLLGAEQWLWLERELRSEIRADLTVIGSGIQVLNDWRPSENWGRFPSERTRLLRLLSDSNTTSVMFISGDVHFAELTEVQCAGVHRKLIDFTSSGISHSLDEEVNFFARPLVPTPNFNHASTPLRASNAPKLHFNYIIPPKKLFFSLSAHTAVCRLNTCICSHRDPWPALPSATSVA
jgi:alkaline phosphatase D